ncbi:hypothetical protein TanjilG_18729 [Lupinus angustifolius]|uniref:NAC domain-containing protein n=1 Tax=Lupinus angustifolius TaxID=3871 RepID=A0A1J7FVQ4_LUPAN|nr:PREDICTED: NAC transcription factor 29-like [Lupinus angustifolius]OIV92157.1 hypothetical protein TanjilG_18729 [Lupinus angustifolius]
MDKDTNFEIQLPPGFRFHPSDEELIVHYLRNKVTSSPLPASFIAEIDLYKYNPWELPGKALFGKEEWYFFTTRDKKYPNGVRPNRAAGSGYWKATGTDKPILTSCDMKNIGVKKTLFFYKGYHPKGSKTEWIMDEYRLHDSMISNSKQRGSMRLDDCVLCRVKKKISSLKSTWEDSNELGYEQTCHFQQMNDNYSPEPVLKNFVHNEYPMLPYILASNTILPNSIGMASSTSFHCNDDIKAYGSVHEDNLNLIGAQFLASASESFFISPFKRKAIEENQFDLYAISNDPSNKKLNQVHDEKQKLQ